MFNPSRTLAVAAIVIASATPGNAAVVLTATETGGDVVIAGGGTVDLTALSLFGDPASCGTGGFIDPSGGVVALGAATPCAFYGLLTPPGSFGTGPGEHTPTSHGTKIRALGPFLALPLSYASGAPLSSSATWAGATFASRGMTPGTYVWSWGSGSTADTLTLIIGGPEVEIDIKPGIDPNAINPFAPGMIPVAILGSDTFDVLDVDPDTLAFGPDGAFFAHNNGPHFDDVDGDGLEDLLVHFRTQETGILWGDPDACLTWENFDTTAFEVCDDIKTVPACGIGFELALLLPPLMWLRRRHRKERLAVVALTGVLAVLASHEAHAQDPISAVVSPTKPLGSPTNECASLAAFFGLYGVSLFAKDEGLPGGTPDDVQFSLPEPVHIVYVKAGRGGSAYYFPAGTTDGSGIQLSSVRDSVSYVTYCQQAQEITYEIFAADLDGDGTIDFSETTTTVYDVNGNVVTMTEQNCDSGVGNGADCRPGRARFNNDDLEGQAPGAPGARLHDETVEY
ncbi:MAG: hypothetical protein ACYTGQ_08725 [Planctomycetota bacterium]|jgi:hypothetical protein